MVNWGKGGESHSHVPSFAIGAERDKASLDPGDEEEKMLNLRLSLPRKLLAWPVPRVCHVLVRAQPAIGAKREKAIVDSGDEEKKVLNDPALTATKSFAVTGLRGLPRVDSCA